MKNLKVTATRIDEYNIQIDSEKWTTENLESWSNVFVQVSDLEDLAENLAFQILRMGSGVFYEGFGYVKTFRASGSEIVQFKRGDEGELREVFEEEYCPGIVVRLISEDDNHKFELEKAV